MDYNIITTPKALAEFVKHYSSVEDFAFDIETIGEDRLIRKVNDVCWLSFATEGRVDVIPMGHPNGDFLHWDKPLLTEGRRRLALGKPLDDRHYSKVKANWTPVFSDPPEQLTRSQVFAAIEPVLFGPAMKAAHNAKFDLESVAKYYGERVPSGPHFDTMMATFIINNLNKHTLSLQMSVRRELGIDIVKGVGEDISKHSFDEVAKYSAIDADVTYKLYKVLKRKLTGPLARVWKLESDVLVALCDMELTGALLDTAELRRIHDKLVVDIEDAKAAVYKVAGKVFAINSAIEKQKLLFLPSPGYPKGRIQPDPKFNHVLTDKGKVAVRSKQPVDYTMFSTGAEALEFYRGKDDLVDALLAYQDLNKLMTTYVIPYLGGKVERVTNGKMKLVTKDSLLINGRVHTNFKAHGAETGRFSSSNPNLQNIPAPRTEYGKMIRNLFIAPPGHKLVVADYSQIEPRLIAAFSGDPELVNNYVTGGDIYTTIGNRMGVDRQGGKTLVLATSYGVGPDKVASSIGCTLAEAKALLDDFDQQFPLVAKLKARTVRQARQQTPVPYVETLFGRRRYIPDLRLKESPDTRSLLRRAERQAFNTVIQGSAADIMKLALVRAHSCFVDEPDINLLLTVHDELVTSTPADRAEETAEAIRVSMEDIKLKELTVPLIADVKIVDRWGEAK